MKTDFLKQSEIFAFIALIFLIGIVLLIQEPEDPPIIILSEQEESFRFDLGSAVVPKPFEDALNERIIPRLDSLMRECLCDAIEVVGHTDNYPVSPDRDSNLDQELVVAYTQRRVANLMHGSNVDLGMIRAMAIINILRDSQDQDRLLQDIRYFFPYSAGQMILPADSTGARFLDTTITRQKDPLRRRIELRLLRSETQQLDQ